MENINNDIIKLTTVLESTQNDNNDESCSSDDEFIPNFEFVSTQKNTEPFLSESITNDEDTIFIIETCSNPLIKNALICNIKKRNILNELIKNLEENLTKIKKIQRENYIRTLITNKSNKKLIIRKRLGIPYFKDKNFFPSPPNDEYISMQKNKHYSVLDCVKKENWSSFHKSELVKAVYKKICENKSKEIQTEIRNLEDLKIKDKDVFGKMIELQEKLIKLHNTEVIDNITKQWQYIKINPDNCIFIKNKLIEKTDDTYFIIKLVNNSELIATNWELISDEYFDLKFTWMECKSLWSCYLHPKFSKDPWKEFENLKLQELVEKWNYENWDLIADELNIQKSAYQCCIHFYSKLYDKFLRTKWTIEEEQLLKDLVAASRIGEYINWTKIAHYFKGRTKAQIYSHYYRAMIPSLTKGTFTIEEDVLLLTLLKLHNNEMKKVKLYFPSRSLGQLRDRFKTMSKDDSQDWTLKDDCRIIEHVEQRGPKKWYLLDDMNRSVACIRHRYQTLKKWFEQNPNDNLEDVQRRYKTAYRRKIKTRFNLLNAGVQELLRIVKNHSTDDKTILNLEYIHKNVLNAIPFYKTLKKNKNNTFFLKNKSSVCKQKSMDSDGTLHHYCVNFFQPAFKKITRGKFYLTNDYYVAKAKRVMNILELLGAHLNLPKNENDIDNTLLTSSDKSVLLELIKLRSTKSAENSEKMQLQYLIPPTPESLIGLRGLMLHSTTLRSHSRGNYEGYNLYVHIEQRFEKKGITYIKRRNDIYLSKLKDEDKQMVIKERALFWKRFKILFSWPCIMQDTKIEPTICEAPPEEIIDNSTVVVKKRGRPTKNNKIWKIDLMNKARLEKKKQIPSNEKSDVFDLNLPSTSKTALNTSNIENTFKITKHENNSFSIHFEFVPQVSKTNKSEETEQISNQDSTTSDSDDELDEDVQKLVMETKINNDKNTNTTVINQMSEAIKGILVKNNQETNNQNISEASEETNDTNTANNKRKAKIIVIPSKKIKINQNV